jgi:hypothetical protein
MVRHFAVDLIDDERRSRATPRSPRQLAAMVAGAKRR